MIGDIAVVLVIVAAIYFFFIKSDDSAHGNHIPSSSASASAMLEKDADLKEFTRDEIRAFDGKEGRPIYIAIANKVFDCSEGFQWYGPGGSYEVFAGRDISRAAAKFSTEMKYLDDYSIADLSLTEKDSMKHYFNVLYGKYTIVGRLKKETKKSQ